jgi:hypothetical protein
MYRLSRRWRARAAPTLIIRRPRSWSIRVGAILLALLAGVALGAWWATRPALSAGDVEAQGAARSEQARRLEAAELNRLQAIANAADSQVKVERSAAERLARQVRELEIDNAPAIRSHLSGSVCPPPMGRLAWRLRCRVEFDAAQCSCFCAADAGWPS